MIEQLRVPPMERQYFSGQFGGFGLLFDQRA
jgi:hypothetical protein